jgi:hypothetical protein
LKKPVKGDRPVITKNDCDADEMVYSSTFKVSKTYGLLGAGLGAKKFSRVAAVSALFRCCRSETQLATVETISRAAAFFDTDLGSGFDGTALTSPFFITLIFCIKALPP